MKTRIALLPIVLSSAMLLGHAADLPRQRTVQRMEYIHFDSVNLSIEWGVSEGTISADGDFVPNENAIATYSIQLQTGEMRHDGLDVQMSLRDSEDASRVFQALALLMQTYTERWDGTGDLDQSDSQEDSPAARISRIAAHGPMDHRSSSARSGDRLTAMVGKKEAFIPQNMFNRGTACTGWPYLPGLKEISWRNPQ